MPGDAIISKGKVLLFLRSLRVCTMGLLGKTNFGLYAQERTILSPALKELGLLVGQPVVQLGLLLGNNLIQASFGQALQENRYIRIWIRAAANQAR